MLRLILTAPQQKIIIDEPVDVRKPGEKSAFIFERPCALDIAIKLPDEPASKLANLQGALLSKTQRWPDVTNRDGLAGRDMERVNGETAP